MPNFTPIPDGYKRCSKGDQCIHPDGPVLPATFDYFVRNSASKDGLRPDCKACHRAQKQRNYPKNREKKLERNHQYWSANRERLRSQQREYYQKHRQEILEKAREYSANNRHRIRTFNQRYYQEHREELRGSARLYRQKHAEKIRDYDRLRAKNDPQRRQAINNYRRARKLKAEGKFTRKDIDLIYRSQQGKCWWCGRSVGDDYHLDHRIPIAKGGSNNPENIVISCPACNLQKHAKMPWEWNGRLL